MRIHIGTEDPTWGTIPLCGNGMFDREDLAVNPDDSDCWECLSIVGIDIDAPSRLEEGDPR